MVKVFHALLNDEFAVGARMRNCRWNHTGPQELRRLFASHDELVGEMMDDIARLALATGNNQTAALAAFLSMARAKAHPGEPPRASEITSDLLAGHEATILRLRESMERCPGRRESFFSRTFLGEMIEKHERMAAELEAVAGKPNLQRAQGLASSAKAPWKVIRDGVR